MENQLTQTTDLEKLTLTKFINDNEKILAVIGVFIALATFLTTLPLKTLTTFLAFLCLVVTIPLFFELYRKLFNPQKTMNLIVFTNIFSLICGYFIWYVLIAFRAQWKTELPKVIFWAIFLPLFILYRRYLAQKFVNLIAYLMFQLFKFSNWLNKKTLIKNLENHAYKCFRKYNKKLGESEHLTKSERTEFRKIERLRLQQILIKSHSGILAISEKHRDEIKKSKFASFLFSALIFCILFLGVDYLSRPVANYLNDYFDKQAEWYKQEEQKLNTSSPSPTVTPETNANIN